MRNIQTMQDRSFMNPFGPSRRNFSACAFNFSFGTCNSMDHTRPPTKYSQVK